MGRTVATIDTEDSPLTRVSAPSMLRAVRCAKQLPQAPHKSNQEMIVEAIRTYLSQEEG